MATKAQNYRVQHQYEDHDHRQTLFVDNPSTRSLILIGDSNIGYQMASLLKGVGWQVDVVHNDLQARDRIVSKSFDIVIADIDTIELGGLPILAFCHHRYPAVITYAIAQANDAFAKKMGRDAAGCQGFFYLMKGKNQIDLNHGMAAQLLHT